MYSYIPLTALTIFTAFYALVSLEKLNSINKSIIKTDIPLIKISEKMIESLYSLELYGNRYFILKSSRMKELFTDESKEFKSKVEQISKLMSKQKNKINQISSLHEEYEKLFLNWNKYIDDPSFNQKNYNTKITKVQDELVSLIQNISKKASENQYNKALTTSNIGMMAFRIIATLCILSIIIGVGAALQ